MQNMMAKPRRLGCAIIGEWYFKKCIVDSEAAMHSLSSSKYSYSNFWIVKHDTINLNKYITLV